VTRKLVARADPWLQQLEILLVEVELRAGLSREVLRELAQLLGQHRGTTVEHPCNVREEDNNQCRFREVLR
jgi:hypothetical protein